MKAQEASEELRTLKRIELLLEALAKVALGGKLREALAGRNSRFIYEHTGSLTAREIARHTGVGIGTISRLWNEWERLGLLVKDGKSFRRVL